MSFTLRRSIAFVARNSRSFSRLAAVSAPRTLAIPSVRPALQQQQAVTEMAQVIANAARSYSVGVNREVDDNGAVVWDYDQVKKLTKGIDRGNILLVDVREVDEVQQGNIPTSINLSVKSLQEALSLSELQFQDKYGFEKPPKEQEIVFYCRSGKRSTAATAIAKAAGYKNLGNYTGSWLDWASKSQGSI